MNPTDCASPCNPDSCQLRTPKSTNGNGNGAIRRDRTPPHQGREGGAKRRMIWLLLAACLLIGVGCCHRMKPLPAGVSYCGLERPARGVAFLADVTGVETHGQRHCDQAIFDEAFRIIAGAERFVLIDFFLYNEFTGVLRDAPHRPLTRQLTDALLAKKRRQPAIHMVVITDPINTVYGGMTAAHFKELRQAGIPVVVTDLDRLRDSNPAYSFFWRLLVKPWGNGPGNVLPNPFGPGRVSVRSWLTLLNFKANHRKMIVADQGDEWVGLVSSANPHDGSSAHSNVALRFTGPAAADLLTSELAVMAFSAGPVKEWRDLAATADQRREQAATDTTVQVVTEGQIRKAVLQAIRETRTGDHIDLGMFYLADRDVVQALAAAHGRGVRLRVLLDPNKDAFGRRKGGIPNRPVGAELHKHGVPVRWADTHGEQFHTKLLLVTGRDGRSLMILGSANLTRRNLDDFNLETDVVVRGPHDAAVFRQAADCFERLWNNGPEEKFSAEFAQFAESSWWKTCLYRFQEATGLSTF